ncbi:DNA-binding transcriptional regulator, XRE-family HTH domain [Pseudobutyrivibrio sp. ACV-2]|uniref:helix-turn-helix domain-containing protein n=1 Tax=Pseudobutyrivibrio sp. ACV-2 TaxID=1520801 RepID=UPI00089858CD|nr:helix-turn-helix transcriptional regulator [Pseudobutyrivibrio sp. ACV-2]SEA70148.1 DNA-binding transcriptional regulator, XRE-family HTH domain [Pseudobutyrivibrio sp. ACV-2]
MSIGQKIKYHRKLKGLKQKDLAAILGISDKTISSWEIDRTEPSMDMINKMCELFKIDASVLIAPPTTTPSLSQDELDIINKYRSLNEYGKNDLFRRADELIKLDYTNDDYEPEP